jgi:hypothetical protein
MTRLAILAAALLALVILRRHREPVAVAPLRHSNSGLPLRICTNCGGVWQGSGLNHPGCLNPLGLQPSDPYPASVLR